MWRFTRNKAITEGFHRNMKLIQRRADGCRNFNNHRLRVIAECGWSTHQPATNKMRMSPSFGVDPSVSTPV